MPNVLLDLLEKNQPLSVTGIDGLGEQLREAAIGCEHTGEQIIALSDEVDELAEGLAVLVKALELATGDEEHLFQQCIRQARESTGE